MKRRIFEYLIVFCLGSITYGLIEVLYRRYTHWTMVLTGGIVFSLLYFINLSMKTKSFILRGLVGCLVITLTELVVGIVVNLIFDMHVWDYSKRPGNVLGQICPLFSLWWFLLSVLCVFVIVFLHRQLNKKLCIHQESD